MEDKIGYKQNKRETQSNHWDFPKTPAKNPDHYCNMMMSYRKLYGKPKNTFIHEPVDYIKYVCQGGGKPIGGNWFESIGFYHTTQCILKYPHRHYIGIKKFKKIILLCKFGFPGGLPVHFAESQT
uniref:Ribonuclease A-domain domain-containing protein n=1 Tax=Pelusios castaneus TaxID=367368 RepID=A0A8C8RWU2_9SAUR